jgi:hypothetical protein
MAKKKFSRLLGENPGNPIRETLLASLKSHVSFRRHPPEKKERLSISGFQTPSGITLALDKQAASKQPIWVRVADFHSHALPHIERKFYSPTDGRNSNLTIYGGDFKDGHLMRLYPTTSAEAREIVDLLLDR